MKLVISTVFFLVSFIGFAQNEITDSLEKVLLNHSFADTNKVNVLNKLGDEYNYISNEKALSVLTEASTLSEQLNYLKGTARSLELKADYYVNRGSQLEAIELFKSSAEKYAELGDLRKKISCQSGVAICYAIIGDWENSNAAFDSLLKDYAKIEGGKKGTGLTYKNMATSQWDQGNLEKANEYYLKAITIFSEIDYYDGMCNVYSLLGSFYADQGKFNEGIDFLLKGLKIANDINEVETLSSIHYELAQIYTDIGEMDKIETHFLKTLEFSEESKNEFLIGLAYIGLANLNIEKQEYQNGLENAEKALNALLRFNNKYKLAQIYSIMGTVYLQQQDFKESLKWFDKSIQLATELNNNLFLAEYCTKKASVYLGLNNNDSAIFWFEKSLAIVADVEGDKQKRNTHELLSRAYENKKEYELSLTHYKKYQELSNKILNEETSNDITRLEVEYEYEKEKEIIQLKQQKKDALKSKELKTEKKIRNIVSGGFVILLILSAFIFYGYNQKKKVNKELASKNEIIENSNSELNRTLLEIEKQKKEKEILLKEIHHRVKNNLQLIWSLLDLQSSTIENKQVKLAIDEGKNRLNSMALIHTMLYQNDDAGNIFFVEYVTKLVDKIKTTFSDYNNVEVKVNIPSDLKFDIDTSVPMGLIITELFTNAMKYGTKNTSKPVIVVSILAIKSDQYRLTISDNGEGLPDGFDLNKLNSLGLMLVENLSDQLSGGIDFRNNKGAEFNVSFKGKAFTSV
jgi:two-component sensor histidine kinase